MSFNYPTHNNHQPRPTLPPPLTAPPYPHMIPPSPHSPSFYFTQQQAFHGGFMRPQHWRPETPVNPEYHRNSMQFQEAMQHMHMVQREMEKQRIRAEIIGEEIMRRRILEEEVRRELMMEREMGLKFGIAGPSPVRIEPVTPLLTNVEPREKSVGLSVPPQEEVVMGSSENLPFQRDPVLAGNVDRNTSISLPEIKDNQLSKDKIIVLAKPSSDLAELKRKAATEPDGAGFEPTSGGVKKQRTKDDWSCALCHVSATNEKGLNEHLNGRRHKARERAMVQKTGFGTDPLPRRNRIRIRRSSKVPVVTNGPISVKKDEKAIDAPAPGGSVQRSCGTTPLQRNNSTSTIQPSKVSVVTTSPSSVKKDAKVDEAPAATGLVDNSCFGTTPFPTMNKTSTSEPIEVPVVTNSLGSVQTNEKAQETLGNNSRTELEFIFPCLFPRSPIAEAAPAPTGMVENSCFGTSPLPTMNKTSTGEPIEVPVVTNTLNSVQTNQKGQETLVAPIAEGASLQKGKCEEKVCGKETNPKIKGKFRFYCELCSVGAYNQRVMDAHMGGKKHLANVSELNKTGENTPAKATEANNVAASAHNESDNAATDTKGRRYTTRSQGKIKQVLTNDNNVSKTEH